MEMPDWIALLEFLAEEDARITHRDSYLVVRKDSAGRYYYTVYHKPEGIKARAHQLYEGHHLPSAIWCLQNEEEYR